MNERFRRFAHRIAGTMEAAWVFTLAVVIILGWVLLGPLFRFSDTWQLVISTISSIVTLLMVILIQNTQNRDAKAIHLKLDELLRGVRGARTHLVNLQELTEDELNELQGEFERLRKRETATKTQNGSQE